MKRLLLFIIVITIFGCSTIPREPVKMCIVTDFTEYSDKNFLFTPYEYEGSYDFLAIIDLYYKDGISSDDSGFIKSDQENRNQIEPKKIIKVSKEEIIEAAYQKAIEIGGDAIVDMNIDVKTEIDSSGEYVYRLRAYHFTGYIIKRNM